MLGRLFIQQQEQQGKIIHSLKRATPLQSDRPPARPSFCPANIILEHGGHKDNELNSFCSANIILEHGGHKDNELNSFCPANIILEHAGHKDNELKPK